MTRISVRPVLALVLAATLTTLATGCSSLADELEREADPARASQAADDAPAPAPSVPDPDDLEIEPSAAHSATDCGAESLRATASLVDAAMGLRAMSITFTNCGTSTYEVNGYPAVTVLDADREPVAIEVLKGTDGISTGLRNTKPTAIRLQPGESVLTTLTWRNTVTDATRPAPHGTYFDIAPAPGRGSHVVQPADGGPIDIGSTAQLGTSAWEKAPADPGGTGPEPTTPN
ncbi:DUF4232 domain-containing protein [Streptomyces sp. TRM66268-LWL]|uniref:DUF4232 domain-containing protein n=1 Tax=Streptomyces polyasparticus TaxID=2767826 RepID=A0ABR7SAW6_9ACTN|nr:DUF4232 domain-containing protein [Streptomyces polyasparticus]MBC9712626.1 DUF4232 domain-containing protein [Streptomyces polyasparticus]